MHFSLENLKLSKSNLAKANISTKQRTHIYVYTYMYVFFFYGTLIKVNGHLNIEWISMMP